MKHLYTLVLLFIISGTTVKGQQPLTDKILIEFMKPGDKDAEAKGYNILPWPEEAKAAAYKAADIWASYLEITVPIRVKFGWCNNIEANAEGSPKYNYQYTDGYYYPLALINQLLGYDRNENVVDITCVFKSSHSWYFGLEEDQQWEPDTINIGAMCSKNSIIPTMLHEICHGLGITSSMVIEDGRGTYGSIYGNIPNIYDSFLCDKQGNTLIDKNIYKNNSIDIANILTSDELYWIGKNATEANNDQKVKIHAPNPWKKGNSICHIATEYGRTINDLMSSGKGGVTSMNGMNNKYTFSPGPIVLGMLQDIGWTVKDTPTANEFTEQKLSDIRVYTIGDHIKIEGTDQFSMISVIDMSGRVRYSGSAMNDIRLSSGIYIVKIGEQSFKVKI